MWNEEYNKKLKKYRVEASLGGGQARIDKQHSLGKLTARERIEYFFDEGTFVEVGSLVTARGQENEFPVQCIPGDGVIVGYGKVNDRIVYASAEDFTVIGGTLGEAHSKKICQIMDMALKMMAPYVAINDSGGARIEEGINSLDGYSGIFYRNTMASGVIPQISVILGPCAGGACYSPAISDFIFMTRKTARMFITGSDVVKAATGESATPDELGGAGIHETKSGVVHFVYEDDKACLDGVKKLLSYLPQSCEALSPINNDGMPVDDSDKIEDIVPDNMRVPYDVKKVIGTIMDDESFFEIQESYAKNIVIGFARMDGDVVGIVANQTKVLAGALDINASEKAARFVRFCDCFNIPLLTLVDVPGFLPGIAQETGGIIRKGAKLLYAYAEATVPKVTLIMRKAFGGAYIAMNSKGMGADTVFAWPIAQTAVMGAEGAVDILYKKHLKDNTDSVEMKKEKIKQYEDKFMNPYFAAKRGFIDEVILPEETRQKIRDTFIALKDKDRKTNLKKHGNIPL